MDPFPSYAPGCTFFYFIFLDMSDGSGAVCAVKQEPEEYEEHANSSMEPMEPIVKIEAGIYIYFNFIPQ